jgi:hypothetical protein
LAPAVVNGTWTACARTAALARDEPLPFAKAEFVERYNAPSTLSLEGRTASLAAILDTTRGVILYDDEGNQRMCGLVTSIERRGDGTCTVIFTDDLVRLWWRYTYPVPAAAFTTAGQTSAYDVRNASAETRAIQYIDYNIGPNAQAARKETAITVPTSLNRGPTAATSSRFNQLGPLVAQLAETAGLRVKISQSWPSGVPKLDVSLVAAPDQSAWARFGTPSESGPGLLGEEWSYKLDLLAATYILSAAGGEGTARILNNLSKTATDEAVVWGSPRIEWFVDQRGTTDSAEISEGMESAWIENQGAAEVTAPIANSDLRIGTEVPLGARVTCVLDGQPIVERIRQITTTISTDGPTVSSQAVFGNPDGLVSPTQKVLKQMLRRVQNLERI